MGNKKDSNLNSQGEQLTRLQHREISLLALDGYLDGTIPFEKYLEISNKHKVDYSNLFLSLVEQQQTEEEAKRKLQQSKVSRIFEAFGDWLAK